MNGRRRLLVDPDPPPIEPGRVEIIWSPPPGGSSLVTTLDPGLGVLGELPAANGDAVRLAVLVFIADRTLKRPRDWTRAIELELPVTDTARWHAQADAIESTLARLTSDDWTVSFITDDADGAKPDATVPGGEEPEFAADLVCLLSGGADSMCGAIRALHDGRRPVFVSHWDAPSTAAHQKEVVRLLADQFGDGGFDHIQVRLGAVKKQVGGNVSFPDEPSRRSRSLLFIALGLASAAALDNVQLWIPENGYASLNPPLTPERMGALSTRTTDPLFLERTSAFLAEVGAHADLTNPYADATKGEMFADVATRVGSETASRLLSATHSCANPRLALQYGYGPGFPCGACFGCLVRRAAFVAADIQDGTDYLVTTLNGDRFDEFFDNNIDDFRAMRHAVARGISATDVLALNLPDGYSLDRAADLLKRGLAELAAVELT